MSPKSLKAAGEVDSWCTKCRLILNHRIIAMVGARPVRVECSTCGSHHNYRPAAPGAKAEAGGLRSPRKATKSVPPKVSEDRKAWERAISGKSPSEFTRYNTSRTFQSGELVRHAKFGDG